MKVYRVFTIQDGAVLQGARVEKFTLTGGRVNIPAIVVGESGRGRRLGVLPVSGVEPGEWIKAARVSKTRSGKPKLVAANSDDACDDAVIVVFRTPIGCRGGNSHTGDRTGEYRVGYSWNACRDSMTYEEAVAYCQEHNIDLGQVHPSGFKPFPGEWLVQGVIAQGDAGRMGNGTQGVAVIPAGEVFRTGYSGRRYGAPYAHYYVFRQGQILAATWEERQLADIF